MLFFDPPLFGKVVRLFQAIIRRGVEAQLHHLHGVDRLSGGRRSWGLDLGGIGGLPL